MPTPVPAAEPPRPTWAEPCASRCRRRTAPCRPDTAAALDAGLERTRGGFMSRLRGALVAEGTDGSVVGRRRGNAHRRRRRGGAGHRARRSRPTQSRTGGPEAAIRTELAALLVARDLVWDPRSTVAWQPGRHPRGGRERDRQDHDHRQAGQSLQGPGPVGHPRRRGHLPRRRHRPAPDLGGSSRRADDRPCPGARTRAPWSTTRSTQPWRVARTWSSPIRPAGCTPART